MMEKVEYLNWGILEYGEAWTKQEDLLKKNLDIKSQNRIQESNEDYIIQKTNHHFIICTHPHVYTLGKSGFEEHLLINNQKLSELKVGFYKTNRGGDITYHGPGQIVGYPILDLEYFFTDLGKYMRSLEEIIIKVIAEYGLVGDRISNSTGVWLDVNTPKARKICAMGVKSSRWVTMHGFALNVNTDLSFFNHIVPCGITDKGVTSLQNELGREIDIHDVEQKIKNHFADVFECEIV